MAPKELTFRCEHVDDACPQTEPWKVPVQRVVGDHEAWPAGTLLVLDEDALCPTDKPVSEGGAGAHIGVAQNQSALVVLQPQATFDREA